MWIYHISIICEPESFHEEVEAARPISFKIKVESWALINLLFAAAKLKNARCSNIPNRFIVILIRIKAAQVYIGAFVEEGCDAIAFNLI